MSEKDVISELGDHFQTVIDALLEGELVFFLGAGVNLTNRPANQTWQQGEYLPDSAELARFLADKFHYPSDDANDLTRVSQYVDTTRGSAKLYKELHSLFNVNYPSTPIHSFLATLPKMLSEKGYEKPNQLIVTTNYDDILERAFKEAGQEFDLIFYMTEAQTRGTLMRRLPDGDLVMLDEYVNLRGRFIHQSHRGELIVIDKPNEYIYLSLDQRPIILKIHGAIDRQEPDRDSFVITEDHYIDYLSRTDASNFVPVSLKTIMSDSHFLFLGYSLRDWNLRVFLHRLWGETRLKRASWAIQLRPKDLDRKFWLKKGDVDIKDVRLEDYIEELSSRTKVLPRNRR